MTTLEITKCPFCKSKPVFEKALNEKLIILTHKCKVVGYSEVTFKDKPEDAIKEWNKQMDFAKKNINE